MPRYAKQFLETSRPTLYAQRKGSDVVLYRDKEDREYQFAYLSLGNPLRPRYGRKWITVDFYRYKLEWLPDADSVTRPTPSPSTAPLRNSGSKR